MAPGLTASLIGQGGQAPYVYSLVSGPGSVNASSGVYTGPSTAPSDPSLATAVIRVTDDDDATADHEISILDPLQLVCEIIQRELGLSNGRVYIWDQKQNEPKDSAMYVVVSVLTAKPFGNTRRYEATEDDLGVVQSLNMLATLSIDIKSRSTEALRRKEEILMALNSDYSQRQQTKNSFFIGALPPGSQFVNLSIADGTAIPYRFNIGVNMQYFVRKLKSVPFFDTFEEPVVTTEP